MLEKLKDLFPDRHPIRLMFHKAKAILAALFSFFPANSMYVIGVTGTKGKTTTTNMITQILTDAGFRVGMMSTTNFQIAGKKWVNESKMTTLSPFFIQKMLRKMVRARCDFAVIEVSSHAIVQNRIWGINFDMAVLTNMGEDHLEYHGGFREYLRTKGLLFSRINRSARKPKAAKILVLNADDENFGYFDQFLADKKYTYGIRKGGTCYAKELSFVPKGVDFELHIPNNTAKVSMPLPGEFNVMNALASSAVALSLGVALPTIKNSLEKMAGVAGRFERVDVGQDFNVIVDYAHTAESLSSLLELYRAQSTGRLTVVFGCTGGGRDKAKRPKMGAAAHKFADMIVLTDDDPYTEDSMKIIDQIAGGIDRKEGEGLWKIPSRYEAVRFALLSALPGDTVLIAGKGAETVQMIGTERVTWDDRVVAREILSRPMEVEL